MFSDTVALYSAIGKPSIINGVASYKGENTSEIIDAVKALKSQHSTYDPFDFYEVDSENNTVEMEFRPPKTSTVSFTLM